MEMRRSRGSVGCFDDGCCFRNDGFEHLRSASDDLAVRELPTDSLIDEEGINRLGKLRSVGFAALSVILGETGVQHLNNIVDLEPFASEHQSFDFYPNIGVFAPVALIGGHAQYSA